MKNTTECPAERAIYFLGGKWKIRIIFLLYQNKKIRFGQIKKILQTITQQMLSKQLKELELDVVVVVRLQGTNAKLAKKILDESDIELISAETINEAATKAVEMIK